MTHHIVTTIIGAASPLAVVLKNGSHETAKLPGHLGPAGKVEDPLVH